MAAIRKIKRAGKRASKFQYSATYQSVAIECPNDKWTPHMISVAFHRRGRRITSKILPWLPSPDSPLRGVVVWSEPETVEAAITLYKGPKDKSYETKEWEFSVINVDRNGHRKVLATVPVNLVQYASALPYEHELQLKLKPVSCKIKKILLEVSLSSVLLKEGKATDDDMISIASMMSISNISMIGNLEDDEDYTITRFGSKSAGHTVSPLAVTSNSISPDLINEIIPSTEMLIDWSQEVTKGYSGVSITNMTTSWRNGLAFCAIIHHYRSDLLDYDQLSPQSIKENNRLAFNIAQELGIACPLTPNMMLLYDIPDKLAVTSFVYQMYNYFTKDVHSAITKPSPPQLTKGLSPSSPGSFDLSKFQEFSFNIRATSPDGRTPSSRSLTGNPYSRHSLQDEKQSSTTVLPTEGVSGKDTPPGLFPGGVSSIDTPTDYETADSPDKNDSSAESLPSSQTTPPNSQDKGSFRSEQATPPSNQSRESCDGLSTHSTPVSEKSHPHVKSELREKHASSLINNETGQVLAEEGVANDQLTDLDENYKRSLTSNRSYTNMLANGRDSPVSEERKERRSSLPMSPTEDKARSDYLRQKARDIMKSHGVGKVTTFEAISVKTRRRLQEARKKSHGSLPDTPPLSSKSLSSSKSDSRLPQAIPAQSTNSSAVIPEATTPVESTNESPTESRKAKKSNSPAKSGKRSKSSGKGASKGDQRHNSLSLVPAVPSSKPSEASLRMASKPPPASDDSHEAEPETDLNSETLPRPENVSLVDNEISTQSMDSPLTWINHENDLHKDILLSQSDYVKTELTLLHKQLKPLEERAAVIEKEIREAMGQGDNDKEELLTVEYFKILNEKNVLIKRQIELNLLEKEEDLEKRQFFINRELRPLTLIPEEQKTKEQKEREEHLLKELLELVNEREWLDHRLTNTTHSSNEESPVKSQNERDESLQRQASSSLSSSMATRLNLSRNRSGSKDCVIS